MSYKKCIDDVKAASKDLFSDKEAKELLETIRKKKLSREISDMELREKMLAEVKEDKRAALIEKRNRLINLKIKQEAIDKIQLNYKNDLKEGVFTTLDDISWQTHGLREEWLGGFFGELKREKLNAFFTKDFENDIMIEFAELNKKNGGKPGKTNRPEAIKIAKLMRKYQRITLSRKNKAGAYISEYDGYVGRTSHDSIKLANIGADAWKAKIMPLLDVDKMTSIYNDDANFISNMLDEVYLGLVTGNHLRSDKQHVGDFIGGFKGPGNLGKRLSKHRVLHFKDAESWLTYNKEFGTMNPLETFTTQIWRDAKNVALLENLGTNPESMLFGPSGIIETLKKLNRSNYRQAKGLDSTLLKNSWKLLSGEINSPVNMNLYKVSNTILGVNVLSKLGSVTISAISDMPMKVAKLRHYGAHPLDAYRNTLLDIFGPKLKTGRDREIAEQMLTMIEGVQGDFMARIAADSGPPGAMSGTMRKFFKWNLLEPWTTRHKTGYMHTLSNQMGQFAHLPFDKINKNARKDLQKRGISSTDWDTIRKGVETIEDGRKFILPESIKDDTLRMKYLGFLAEQTDTAVITPGLRERAIMRQGTRRGTLAGEATMHLSQFKSFGITVWDKIALPMFKAGWNKDPEFFGMAQTIVEMSMFGYLAMGLKDLLRGKEPRPITPESIMAAMAQGGGMGIFGDFIFGEHDRFGRGIVSTLSGPTGGMLEDIYRVYSNIKRGKDASAANLQLIKNNTPFINLFYTRTALDYLILYNFQEMVNPGYTKRLERKLLKENKQKFILPPSKITKSGHAKGNIIDRIGYSAKKLVEEIK